MTHSVNHQLGATAEHQTTTITTTTINQRLTHSYKQSIIHSLFHLPIQPSSHPFSISYSYSPTPRLTNWLIHSLSQTQPVNTEILAYITVMLYPIKSPRKQRNIKTLPPTQIEHINISIFTLTTVHPHPWLPPRYALFKLPTSRPSLCLTLSGPHHDEERTPQHIMLRGTCPSPWLSLHQREVCALLCLVSSSFRLIISVSLRSYRQAC